VHASSFLNFLDYSIHNYYVNECVTIVHFVMECFMEFDSYASYIQIK
jgi:hypothetical protein